MVGLKIIVLHQHLIASMGKIKRSTNKSRSNPLARTKPASTVTKSDGDAIRRNQIVPVVQNLQRGGQDTLNALIVAQIIAQDDTLRPLLLKERLLKAILEHCIPQSNTTSIKTQTLALLQVVVEEEGYEAGIFLFRNKILDTIESCLASIRDDIQALDPQFVQYTYGLIGALAACDETIFDSISERFLPELGTMTARLIEMITSTENNIQSNVQVLDAICETCSFLSDRNEPFLECFNMQNMDIALRWAHASVPTKIFGNYFMLNAVESWLSQSAEPEEIERAMKSILNTCLDCTQQLNPKDLAEQSNLMTTLLHSLSQQQDQNASMNTPEFQALYSKYLSAKVLMNSAQTLLELLAAIAETYEEGFGGSASGSDETQPSVGANDEEEAEQGENETDQDYFDRMIERAEQKRRMLDMPNDIDFSQDGNSKANSNSTQSILDILNDSALPWAVQNLQVDQTQPMAMTALNNISWTLSAELNTNNNDKWAAHAKELWLNLVSSYFGTNKNTSDLETLCGCIGSLGAVAQAFKGHVPLQVGETLVVPVIIGSCERIKHEFGQTDAEQVSQYIEKALDVLACVTVATATGENSDPSTAAMVGAFIMDDLLADLTNVPVPLLVRSLNAIFDIFGDKAYSYDTPVFVASNYLGRLQQQLPIARKLAKRVDKKKEPELRAIIDEAVSNLGRFIEYKQDERS